MAGPLFDFSGQVVLVVGGTTGIGFAAAQAFAKGGARLVVASRNEAHGAQAAEALRAFGSEVEFCACDVTHEASVASLIALVRQRFGRLDVAVNSAAFDTLPAASHEVSSEAAQHTWDTDVLGVFHCLKHEIEAMLAVGGGTVVNVSSVNGLSGVPTAAVYAAGKHAVNGLTKSMAKEYIGRGIRINAVCPGATDTPRRQRRTAHRSEADQEAQRAQLAAAIPIGRLAHADEIASAIVWLCSPASSYVVGHCLAVDGGLSA